MPHILGGACAIGGPVIGEKGVTGIGVHLILVSLVVLVQFLPKPGRVGWRWIGVFLPEKGQ